MSGRGGDVRRVGWATRGQSTVEYAIALVAVLAAILALGHLWQGVREGQLTRRSEQAASHQVGGDDALGAWKDVSLF